MHLSLGDRVPALSQRRLLVSFLSAPLLAGVATILLLWCLSASELQVAYAHAPSEQGGRALFEHHSDRDWSGMPGLRRLTFDGHSIPQAWTPEGRSLLVRRPGQVVPGQQLYELWRVSLEGEGERRLAGNAVRPAVMGTQVAYLRYVERGRWEAVVAALADGQPVKVRAARWNVPPAWIAGDWVYLHPAGQWAPEWALDELPPLSRLPAAYTRARLSPDGQRVAATDGRRLWVLEEGEPHVVAEAEQIWDFVWSPATARLAYVRSEGGPLPELWLWDAGTDRSWMLARGKLEHYEQLAWSPDGRVLALVRRPTGNGANAAGDIWLARVRDGNTPRSEDSLYPWALTEADESSPCWSPDGHKLAFALNGDVWVADIDAQDLRSERAAPPREVAPVAPRLEAPGATIQAAPLGWTAPLTIWVLHDGTRNTCRDVPDGQIDALPFEQYVKQVVPNEVPALWPIEAVKAQAVAARTYGWRKALDRPYPAYPYTVVDSTGDQYMCDRTHYRSDAAVDATRGQYVGYASQVIYAFYCAEAGDPTNYRMLFPSVPYLRPVSDPVGFGRSRRGHSWGMSQWGAYRWALWHGWDYGQILSHYYTSAGIEPSTAFTRPLAALLSPWSDHYVTTDRAPLLAHTGHSAPVAAGGVLTVAFAARVTDTWTTVHTDVDPGDGWGYVWPVGSLSDTVTPSIDLKVMAYDGAGHVVESSVTRVGLNRTPPLGTLELSPLLSSTEVTTLAVPLVWAATDPSPDRGPIQISLGSGDWVWEDGAMAWTAGERVMDDDAGDGRAWHVGSGTVGTLSSADAGRLAPGPAYRAYVRLKTSAWALTSTAELVRLAALVDTGSDTELLGVRYVRGTEFVAGDVYQEFALDVPGVPDGGGLEWRIDSFGASDLWVDRIAVAGYPMAPSSPITWTLPPREGPATILARFEDGAGNASPPVSLGVTVADRSPPGSWRRFQCSVLTCTVQVRDAIAGLDTGSAAVRLSEDGGHSWGNWLPALCSGEDGSHEWETLTAPVSGSPARGSTQQVQFRVYDRAAHPNQGRSPTYLRIQVYLPIVLRGAF